MLNAEYFEGHARFGVSLQGAGPQPGHEWAMRTELAAVSAHHAESDMQQNDSANALLWTSSRVIVTAQQRDSTPSSLKCQSQGLISGISKKHN